MVSYVLRLAASPSGSWARGAATVRSATTAAIIVERILTCRLYRMIEKLRERRVERLRVLEVGQMSGAGKDFHPRAGDAMVHLLGRGFWRHGVFLADENQ